MKFSCTAAWLPLSALLVTSAALANDEAGFAPPGDRDLETVTVTATRRPVRTRDVPNAISQVGLQDVLQASPDVIAEVLRGQPGAFFQQTTPGQGMPIIRGLKGSQVLHMVDGMRLNNAFFRSAPNQYLALVDSYSVARVELVRGASGALYGADAMGGVVQVLTRNPLMSDSAATFSGRLYGAWNSADNGLVLHADGNLAGENAGLTGGVTWQDYSDRRTANGTVSPSGYRSEAGDLKAVFNIGSHSELMLSAYVLEQPSTPRTDELVAGYGQQQPASEQFSFEPNRRSFLHGRYSYEGQAPWLENLEIHLARQVIDDDRLTQDFGVPEINREQNTSTLDGLTAQVISRARGSLTFTWGLELYRDEVRSARQRTFTESGQNVDISSRFPDGSSMDSDALYLVANWLAFKHLDVHAGIRYSRFDIDLAATDHSAATQLEPDDFSGDVRLLYHLDDRWGLAANFGRGFRPPNIFDLGTLGPRPGNRFNVANTSLAPETVWSYDLGFKFQDNHLQAEFFVFYLDYKDKITSVETGETTPEGRSVVRSENQNKVSLYGVEGSVNWLASDAINAFLVVNYTRGEESDDSSQVFPADRIPPLNGQLGINWQATDRISVSPYILFAGRQDRLSPRDVRDPRINPDGTDSWVSLNLDLAWQATPSLQLGLRLENLADQAYREHGSGIDAPGFNVGLWANTSF